MDIMAIVETFGVPVAVAIAFGYFIWKQNKYIQDDLTKDLNQQFQRLEGIIIQLINQQKKMQLEVKGMKSSYDALVKIITNLLNKK
jgi:starvation-inducible outer membrane lipoprotein